MRMFQIRQVLAARGPPFARVAFTGGSRGCVTSGPGVAVWARDDGGIRLATIVNAGTGRRRRAAD